MNRFALRIKLCLKDVTACICYVVSAVVLVCLLMGLDSAGEERSAVPVGLVCYDSGTEAASLVEAVTTNPALYVYQKDRSELEDMLLEGYVNSIIVINEEYSLNVRNGMTDGLIEIISGEDDKISVVVGDIIAGSMLYDICMNKGYKMYLKQEGNLGKSREEYKKYVLATSELPDFTFGFELEYRDANNGLLEEKSVTNGMLYRQMIAGMLAMLLSLVSFAACNGICSEYESGSRRRLKNLPIGSFVLNGFDFLGVFVYTLPLGLSAGYLLGGIKGMAVCSVYLLFICFVCIVLSNLCKKTDAYQLVGAVLIVALGVCGFISVFSVFVGGGEYLRYTPNAVFINYFLR